jgi:hypothetical protein
MLFEVSLIVVVNIELHKLFKEQRRIREEYKGKTKKEIMEETNSKGKV